LNALEFIAVAKVHREVDTARLVAQIIEKKATIKEVVIYNDETMNIEMLRNLLQTCGNITKITAHRCKQITEEILRAQTEDNWGCSAPRDIVVLLTPYEPAKYLAEP